MEEQNGQLMALLKEVYDDWCARTGNPGGVRLAELESAAAMMGDLHQGGRLLLPPRESRRVVLQLLENLNEKSLYVQSRSFLPSATKGMPGWVKWLVLALGVIALALVLYFAEGITARTQAQEGVTSAAVYSIA